MNSEDAAEYEALLAAGTENARYQRMMEQQQKQAQLMRERSDPGQGQMISGHYVAPHALQRLAGLANSAGAAYMDKKAGESGAGLEGSMGKQNQMILARLLRAQQQPKVNPYAGMEFNPNADTRTVTPGMDY